MVLHFSAMSDHGLQFFRQLPQSRTLDDPGPGVVSHLGQIPLGNPLNHHDTGIGQHLFGHRIDSSVDDDQPDVHLDQFLHHLEKFFLQFHLPRKAGLRGQGLLVHRLRLQGVPHDEHAHIVLISRHLQVHPPSVDQDPRKNFTFSPRVGNHTVAELEVLLHQLFPTDHLSRFDDQFRDVSFSLPAVKAIR